VALGISKETIAAGLNQFKGVKGRMQKKSCLHGATLIDDTYNSNPDSMAVAIDSLAEMRETRLIVMGDMGEVGEQGLAFHAEVGEYAQARHIEKLFTFGLLTEEAAKHFEGAQHFASIEALNEAVTDQLHQVSSILVKGSRFMKMERVAKHIMAFDKKEYKNKETGHVA